MNSLRFLIAAAIVTASASADDWFQWRGPDRNGISAEENLRDQWPATGPPIRWKGSVGTGFSSATVAAGRLFTLGNRENMDTVYCLDAESGKLRWKHSYESPLEDRFFEGGPTSTPTIGGDSVYTLGRQGDLFCFDAATGAVNWSQDVAEATDVRVPGWGFAASPVVHGDIVLVGVGETGTAVDKRTGAVLWSSADADAGYATPLPVRRDDQWFVLIASGKFYHMVDMATGQEAWRLRWLTRFGANAADPIVSGDHVFISSGYNRGSALLKLTNAAPEIVWKGKEFQSQFSSSVLIDGFLYGVDGDTSGERALKCVELQSGEVRWAEHGFGSGALMAANNRLIILSESGELVIAAASADAFRALARAKIMEGKCWTAPVLSNGQVYCRSADGEIVCVDLRN